MAEFLQQCGSWGVLATLAAYAAGVWINRKTGKALFNPLLMGSIFVIVFLSCFGVPYADYKSSAQPVNWLLMPATVSLAIPLYEKWELLEKNLAAIFASIAAGVLTSLGSVLAMAWLLKLERAHAVSFLPKSVTTAIGMDVAETLGGTAALAGAVIITMVSSAACWARRSARSATSPIRWRRVWRSAHRRTRSARARPCRWVRSRAP